MQPRRRVVTSLGSILTLVLVVGAWLVFAPTQLGGRTSYVIVNGNSMEPGMRSGDLAVVREQSRYGVGDIVTYRHPDIGTVIHRIIGRESDRYLLQGDHNSFIDPYQPARADRLGQLWFRVPAMGGWVSLLRSPVYVGGLLVVAFVGFGGSATVLKRKQGQPSGTVADQRRTMQPLLSSGAWQDILTLLGAATIGLLVLGVAAFRMPQTRTVPDETPYRQTGEFVYSAVASDGSVYDSGGATTGEPIFRRLSDAVAVEFTYALESKDGRVIPATGEYRFVAEITNEGGWRRSIDLGTGSFASVPFTVAGTLKFAEMQAVIDTFERQTGLKSPSYTVILAPRVQPAATIAGKAIAEPFAPALKLALDPLELKLLPALSDQGDPLRPAKTGIVTGSRVEANTLGLPLLDLRVDSARWISLFGLGVVLSAVGLTILLKARARGGPPRIAERLGASLVSASGVPVAPGRTVDLSTLADLAKIARHEGCVILQQARPGFHAYFVHLGDLTYRYQALGEPDAEPRAAARPRTVA